MARRKKSDLLLVDYYEEWVETYKVGAVREITCPYCNSSQSDSWEAPDEGDYECETCGGTYGFQRNVEVSYSSKRLKAPVIIELKKVR